MLLLHQLCVPLPETLVETSVTWLDLRSRDDWIGRMTQIAPIADEASPPYGGEYREGRETSLRRACLGSYRERRGVLTESVFGLLPRAQRRSYRERLCALGMFVFVRSGCLIQRRLCGRLIRGLSYLGAGNLSGLTHEITIVRGQGREGVYVEDRSVYVLA